MAEKYPEQEKLKSIGGANQVVGDFIGWLGEQDIELCERYSGPRGTGLHEGELFPTYASREDLLARFFDIDRAKLEAEKDQMLADLRKSASG